MSVLDLFRLDGKVAVVTGASSGLGADFAVSLAQAGADVVLAARRADRLDQTADAMRAAGRRAFAVTTDVRDPDACQAVIGAAVAEFGRVDYLVNNAGVAHTAPSTRESPDRFRHVVEVNLNGVYWMAQACGQARRSSTSRRCSRSRRRGFRTRRTPPPRRRSSG
jgi:NADP-dependent 3-hydroxy acid dehydrogenase YdfG